LERLNRPDEARFVWQHSWPALVAIADRHVVGFVRGITDGEITTYIGELLVQPDYRGQGIGRMLLDVCHALFPHARLDLISTEEALPFYRGSGFRKVGDGMRKSYR
jgi:GNAT superfamily N-acetyltransferase